MENQDKQKTDIRNDEEMMLRNILMAFHFLHKNMIRKIISSMIIPKLEYTEAI